MSIKIVYNNKNFKTYFMNENKKFFELLKYSNELKTKSESLELINIENFETLVMFLVRVEENLHYLNRKEYIELLENFLTRKINLTDFCDNFLNIYQKIIQKRRQLEKNESLELNNLLSPSRRELGELLLEIFYICQDFTFDSEISQEEELKNCAKLLLLKLRE